MIKPRYVLLDTNCLIGNLEAVKRLVVSAPFTVLIPLIGNWRLFLLSFFYLKIIHLVY